MNGQYCPKPQRESHLASRWGQGCENFLLVPTPYEKPNESLVDTRFSFGFSLWVGVGKISSQPPPLTRSQARVSSIRESHLASRWGSGCGKFLLAPTPYEKPNESLIATRFSFGISLGVGVWKISVSPYPLREAKRDSRWGQGWRKSQLAPTPNEKSSESLATPLTNKQTPEPPAGARIFQSEAPKNYSPPNFRLIIVVSYISD